MFEQSKASKRRYQIGNFHSKYFVGNGIDVGAGNDCLENNISNFIGIKSVRNWDLKDGDAQYLQSIPDNYFDFLHSSHCLEHMVNYKIALINWIRVCKPGGYLIITIPEEQMYEKNKWPSNFNNDHKWSFTLKSNSQMPKSVNCIDMLKDINNIATIEKLELINEFYNYNFPDTIDQTMMPNAECCIEIIIRKI